jgi:hypothetical protein
MVPYIHIFYKARGRRKNSGFLGFKMVPYIHIWIFFGGQKTHFRGVFGSKCYHMYTFYGVFWVKMLPDIHISVI